LHQSQAVHSKSIRWLLAPVAEQPDLTLSEIVAAMRKRRITGSRGAYGGSSVAMAAASKKACKWRSKSAQNWLTRADVGC